MYSMMCLRLTEYASSFSSLHSSWPFFFSVCLLTLLLPHPFLHCILFHPSSPSSLMLLFRSDCVLSVCRGAWLPTPLRGHCRYGTLTHTHTHTHTPIQHTTHIHTHTPFTYISKCEHNFRHAPTYVRTRSYCPPSSLLFALPFSIPYSPICLIVSDNTLFVMILIFIFILSSALSLTYFYLHQYFYLYHYFYLTLFLHPNLYDSVLRLNKDWLSTQQWQEMHPCVKPSPTISLKEKEQNTLPNKLL